MRANRIVESLGIKFDFRSVCVGEKISSGSSTYDELVVLSLKLCFQDAAPPALSRPSCLLSAVRPRRSARQTAQRST